MTNMDFIEMAPVDDEDSAFLVVSENSPKSHKKTEYEPSVLQTCQCCRCGTKRVTCCLLVAVVIVTSALIGVLARPIWLSACLGNTQVADQSTASSPATETTTQELSSNGTPYPWKDVRLPRNILPDSYHIHMHPNLTESWFRGKVEIRLRVENETKFIIFHAKSINITSQVLMYDSPGKRRVDIIQTMAYKPFEQYYLALGRTLLTGDKVLLILEFDGVLERKLTGFYKSSYKTKTNETRDIATTDFEPTDARTAFPCFDEPDIKANFSLSMVRDKHHISLFNMPLKGSEPYQGSALLVEDKFEASVKMSTYLVAFVVCDFANLTSSTESGVKVRVFAPPDNIQEGQFALDIAIKVLPFYEEFFGIKYPLPKQDLIAIPDFNSGAMENWGLITYRTTSVLYDPEATSFSSQQHVASTVAHELAHQWFGNLVTMKWWDDLWLNEGFASYMEYIGTNIVKPEWKMLEQFFIEDMHDALSLDALATSHAIQTHVTNPNQINEIFDSISYNKGSTLVRMLHNFLGEANFKKGLQAYLKKYMFRNSETANLWDSLSQFSKDVDVKAMMDTWTLQMGYPVVNLTRTGNTITAIQERFLLDSEDVTQQKPSQFGYKWYIPLNYITSENVNTSSEAMMKLSSVTFDVPPQTTWIKANVGMYGLYRVNYDESMWRQLTELLLTNHKILSPNDRAGLIDDAFTLAGPLNVTVALNLSSYLIHERDYAPWVKAISQLGYMRHRLQDSPVYADLKKYILHLLRPVLRGLKWDKALSHLDNFLRDDVFKAAITLGEESTIAEAKKRFATWMSANQSLDADLKSIVYKAGIQYGGETEWEFCWNRYLETNIASEKKLLLLALHKTRDTQLLTRLLHYSLDPDKIRAQDCDDVIGGVAGNPAGKLLAWRFLRQNWVRIRDRVGFGAFAMTGLIKRTLSSFSTQFDYDEVKAFFDGRDVGPGARAVQQALERIKMNIDWLETHEVTVANWLRDRNS